MKRIVLTILTLAVSISLGYSQNEVDALRYSTTDLGGTARFLSMGGAFGSLGADFSTISTNPAGLGLYKMSEFSFTPSFFIGRTNSDYYGNSNYDTQHNFNFSNAGLVYTSKPKSGSIVKNVQFGFGINRTNNFNNRMIMEGVNPTNSITDMLADNANGINNWDINDDYDGFYTYDLSPAWHTYMIDTVAGYNDLYQGAVPSGEALQRQEIYSSGSMNDLVIALGSNINDRLYLGASLNFPTIRYFQESLYTELDENDDIFDFNELQIYDYLTTRGSGFNMKFGAIVRATDYLRIGAAIHSPTWYNNMTDEWHSEYSTNFDNGDSYFSRTPDGYYDYQLTTPWKALGSVSFIIARMALVSAEYEYVDYTSARLRSTGYSFYNENDAIKSNYAKAHNFRLGTELRFGHFAVRGGAGYYASPFANDINDGEKITFSGGFGFRDKNFFLDLAYVQTTSKEDYYFYGSENVITDPAKNKFSTYNMLMTLGFRY